MFSSEPGDRNVTDDYFPQGEDYEDEIGSENPYTFERNPSRDDDDDSDNMVPTVLQYGDHNLKNFQQQIQFLKSCTNPLFQSFTKDLFSKDVSDKDTFEKLKTLVEKAIDFKRRVFQARSNEKKKENKSAHKNKSGNDISDSSGQERLVPTI